MNLLAAPDRPICRIQLTGQGRWVSVALSLGELAPANRFLVGAEGLLYEMAAADEASHQYNLANWQGGVISGVRYAFRTLHAPLQQVCLHELRGQVGSSDVSAVAAAAALAVARLLGRSEVPLDLGGWVLAEENGAAPSAETVGQSTRAASPHPDAAEAHASNAPRASEQSDPDGPISDTP